MRAPFSRAPGRSVRTDNRHSPRRRNTSIATAVAAVRGLLNDQDGWRCIGVALHPLRIEVPQASYDPPPAQPAVMVVVVPTAPAPTVEIVVVEVPNITVPITSLFPVARSPRSPGSALANIGTATVRAVTASNQGVVFVMVIFMSNPFENSLINTSFRYASRLCCAGGEARGRREGDARPPPDQRR